MSSSQSHREFIEQWKHSLAPYNLGYKLKLASQLMYRHFSEELEPYSLTPFHYLVLCCLWEQDGLSTSGIANRLKQLGATLTGVVDRMERRNLVYRQRDDLDRRVVRIWLTDEGKSLMNVLPVLGEKTVIAATQNMSESERETTIDLLNLIISNLS